MKSRVGKRVFVRTDEQVDTTKLIADFRNYQRAQLTSAGILEKFSLCALRRGRGTEV